MSSPADFLLSSKTLLVSSGLIILVMLGAYGFYAAMPEAPEDGELPEIEVSSEVYDFGEVEYGSEVRTQFTLYNRGEADLQISDLSTSCPCAVAELSSKKLAPGDTSTLDVVYYTDQMPALTGTGFQERFVFVGNNDPRQPLLTVELSGNVN